VGSSRIHEVSDRCLADDGTTIAVEGTVTLLRTDAGILATATLSSTTATTCSRCLAPAEVLLGLSVEEEYYPTVDIVSGAALPPPADASAFVIDAHHILSLCEAVRQQRILAEPMQPLCRPGCAGLCPSCGADLNTGACTCPPAGIDARWAALSEVAETRER